MSHWGVSTRQLNTKLISNSTCWKLVYIQMLLTQLFYGIKKLTFLPFATFMDAVLNTRVVKFLIFMFLVNFVGKVHTEFDHTWSISRSILKWNEKILLFRGEISTLLSSLSLNPAILLDEIQTFPLVPSLGLS